MKLLLTGKPIIKGDFFRSMADFAKLFYIKCVFKRISESESQSLKDAKETLRELKKFRKHSNSQVAELILKVTRKADYMLSKKEKLEVVFEAW